MTRPFYPSYNTSRHAMQAVYAGPSWKCLASLPGSHLEGLPPHFPHPMISSCSESASSSAWESYSSAQLKGGILAYLNVQVASANRCMVWWESAAGAIAKMVSCTCTVLAFQLNPRRCGFTGSAGL